MSSASVLIPSSRAKMEEEGNGCKVLRTRISYSDLPVSDSRSLALPPLQNLPQARLLLSQGWGLIDLLLRASNEGLLMLRVALAQKIIRLHPFFPLESRYSPDFPVSSP